MYRLKNTLPGILLCLLIAIPSWFLGKAYPLLGGPIIAILIGIGLTSLFPHLLTHSFNKQSFQLVTGVKYTSKKILQYSIILLGFEMNLYHIIEVGKQSLIVMLFTIGSAFITAYFLGKLLKLPGDTTTLIGVGTCICGGSAIAATAPVIEASDEDVAHAISTIFLFNIAAVFLFPFLGHLLGMSDSSFGMWVGTAVNDTSSVVATGTAWSEAAGNNTALQLATIVKLTRTLMIVPITLFLAVYTARKKGREGAGHFNFTKVFPWFIIFFVVAALINTFTNLSPNVATMLVTLGKFMIVMAMSAIGLSTNLKSLLANGIKPILLGLGCWAVIASVSLIVQSCIGL